MTPERDGYDNSSSYTVLGIIGLILLSPFIAAFWLLVGPFIKAYAYVHGWGGEP